MRRLKDSSRLLCTLEVSAFIRRMEILNCTFSIPPNAPKDGVDEAVRDRQATMMARRAKVRMRCTGTKAQAQAQTLAGETTATLFLRPETQSSFVPPR